MAGALRMTVEADTAGLKKFVASSPYVQVHLLTIIAKRGREVLRDELLSGQALNLKRQPKDKIGRHLISGKPGRNFSITWSSYPVNLYERGRTLRSGRREPGRYIITQQFRTIMQNRLQNMADRAARQTYEKAVAQI
jgi:hypothetical protein